MDAFKEEPEGSARLSATYDALLVLAHNGLDETRHRAVCGCWGMRSG